MRNYRKVVQLETFEYIETSFSGEKWKAKFLFVNGAVAGSNLCPIFGFSERTQKSWLFGNACYRCFTHQSRLVNKKCCWQQELNLFQNICCRLSLYRFLLLVCKYFVSTAVDTWIHYPAVLKGEYQKKTERSVKPRFELYWGAQPPEENCNLLTCC